MRVKIVWGRPDLDWGLYVYLVIGLFPRNYDRVFGVLCDSGEFVAPAVSHMFPLVFPCLVL